MPRVASLWRHPIKAVGRETIDQATFAPGQQTLPGDRLWAVAHETSRAEAGTWARCMNFIRAASSPRLMAVEARLDGTVVHLTHPDRPPLSVDPDRDEAALIAWLQPLIAEGRARPTRVVRAPAGRGMTDTSDPSITLAGTASHRAVAAQAGRDLSIHRWRANIWVDGLEPWAELDLLDRRLRIGGVEFEVYKRIERCLATASNPETGVRDADLLGVLDTFGHRDFSVGLKVVGNGTFRVGDRMEVL